MIDHFTKYAEATVLTEVRADTTWAAFYERWIAIWGCPTSLLSDNGPQFRAGEWQQQCSALGIKKIYTTPYHPQGNGIIEAFHQFLNRTVSAYVAQTTWTLTEIIASVLLAYRSTPHPVTGESPHFLMTGIDLVLPHFQDWADHTSPHLSIAKRFDLLAQVRKDCLDNIVRRLAGRRARIGQKNTIQAGDLVIAALDNREMAKLVSRLGGAKYAPMWSEPCRVIRFCNPDKSTAVIRSIWHRDLQKQVPITKLTKIPRTLGQEALQMAKLELIADCRREMVQSNTEWGVQQHLQRIPAEERNKVLSQLDELDSEWKQPETEDIIVDIPATPKPSVIDTRPAKRRKLHGRPKWTILRGKWLKEGGNVSSLVVRSNVATYRRRKGRCIKADDGNIV